MSASSKRSSTQRALRARDAGLTKISFVTRALVAGAVAATGLFSTLAAWAQPGRAQSVGASSNQVGAPGPSVHSDQGDAGGNAGLTPPATLPTSGYQYGGPAVVSGAS